MLGEASNNPGPAPAPASGDAKIAVRFASVDGRRIDVALQNGGGVGQASNGVTVATSFWDPLCTTPCSARVPQGRSYLMFSEPDSSSISSDAFLIDSPTTTTLKHESRSGTRKRWFYGSLALFAGSLGGGYLIGGTGGTLLAVIGGTFGATGMFVPLFINDGFSATRSP
jgi:hypothetical protein